MPSRDSISNAPSWVRIHADCLHVLALAPPAALPKERLMAVVNYHLERLYESAVAHFTFEEQAGYLKRLPKERPDLALQTERLHEQHGVLTRMLTELIQQSRMGSNFRVLSDRIAELVEQIEAHEHEEQQLLSATHAA